MCNNTWQRRRMVIRNQSSDGDPGRGRGNLLLLLSLISGISYSIIRCPLFGQFSLAKYWISKCLSIPLKADMMILNMTWLELWRMMMYIALARYIICIRPTANVFFSRDFWFAFSKYLQTNWRLVCWMKNVTNDVILEHCDSTSFTPWLFSRKYFFSKCSKRMYNIENSYFNHRSLTLQMYL